MPNYQQGKIYTIRCRTDDTLIYVGSTIQSLAVRWGGHKADCKREKQKNSLIYRTINNDWDNWFIELYELYPCSCKEELCRREGEIIRLIATLNSEVAGRTKQEWSDQNKEWFKKYREENKDKLYDNFKKNNIKIECECGCIINKNNLSKHTKRDIHINALQNKNISL